MKRVFIITTIVSFCLLNVQCAKDEKNKVPNAVSLIYPTENLLCIDNSINFNWSEATDPEDDELEYNLIIATDRAMTNIVHNSTVTSLQALVSLEKQTAYYWRVDAVDIDNDQGTSSEIYAFYTKGDAVLNYAPFTAELVSPENDSKQSATTSISLEWNAADANAGDTLTYELYFGENSTLTLIDDSLSDKTHVVSVESGKTYSWKVNVKDQNGAKSIGQTWGFTVN
ncbi:hypothetical protein SAMN05216503_0444 [Polaribacter sp. KT25b]|uniref:hypothetical protein n=1 Tax=Polaribacter sp. KT25b TaxID=1855336 RepID=UPI0008794D7A|nr:hypothetical protein [Polaribacter sp. KT25b]SDR69309.1 hypothetical protein SAMN05216503_0444 [Polaribacter sp. KT25b]